MASLRTYETEVVFEVHRTFCGRAEGEDEARSVAIREFREWFAEQYDVAPSASELDVYALRVD
jgi:hypothetical protein